MATLNNSNNSVLTSNMIFCGLVAGYQGEGNTATPQNAADAVRKALADRGVNTEVFPAVCVYHTEWGCPVGGEPVGAYSRIDNPERILAEAEQLRQDLKQSTLSVGLPGVGTPTLGFTAMLKGDCREIGAAWQEIAGKQFDATGTYVSCGITQYYGYCVIAAEANPAFVQDLDAWKAIVATICGELGTEAVFTEIGFNYLTNNQ